MHQAHTGDYNDVILKNLSQAVESKTPVIARIPVIPGFNDSLLAARQMAQLLVDMGIREVHLLPFHQLGEKSKDRLSGPARYLHASGGSKKIRSVRGVRALR